jgi:WhiB family redox-sensing transcriptional regulator
MLKVLLSGFRSDLAFLAARVLTDDGGDRDARGSALHAVHHPSSGVTMAQLSRLPKPLMSTYEWQRRAACADTNPHVFFHPEGERGPARQQRDAAAVARCAGCVVVEDCRTHGLSAREPYGVWGGLTEGDREEIYRREGRSSWRSAAAS